jgi:hypothetical protein
MSEHDDFADSPSPLPEQLSWFGEITKDEIWILLDYFLVASSQRDRLGVVVALRAWGILQREPFLTWMREWASASGGSRPGI